MVRRLKTQPRRAPHQKRAEDTVAVLVEAAKRVVAKEGIEGASTNHIARVAGVSIGTLYRYFPTKEALIQQVVHALWEEEIRTFRARAAELEEEPLERAVPALLDAIFGVVRRHAPFYARMQAEPFKLGRHATGEELLLEAEDIVRTWLLRRLDDCLTIDVDFAAPLIVRSVIHQVRASAETPEREAGLARELSRMLLRYLLGSAAAV